MSRITLAEAASGLVGCRFRLHGRDPATGLDCVGVVVAVMVAAGAKPQAPYGYGLRNLAVDQWLHCAARSGLVPAPGSLRAGDVLLVSLSHCQHHLAVAADETSVIHAHAGLRQVVRQPIDPTWQVCAKWRAAPQTES